LDFPKDIKIYPFFSIIHFEAVENNFYNQFNPSPAFIIIDEKQTHLVDRILKKKIVGNGIILRENGTTKSDNKNTGPKIIFSKKRSNYEMTFRKSLKFLNITGKKY
jgi:hypothetical protein